MSTSDRESGGALSTPPPARPAAAQPLDYARPLFVESQRFTQWWLWAILIALAIVPLVQIAFLLWRVPQASPKLRLALLGLAVPVAMPIFFAVLRLNVVVTPNHLIVRFFPVRRRIAIADIASFHAGRYTFRQAGGRGLKFGFDGSMRATVSGDQAVRIKLKNGRALLIGTRRREEFASALEQAGATREPE